MAGALALVLAPALVLTIAMKLALVARLAAAEEAAPPAELVPLGASHWALPLELQLRDRLAELPKLRDSLVAIEKELEERIPQNRRRWQETRPAVEAAKKSLARLSSGDARRKPLEAQLAALEEQAVEPARLGARRDAQARVIELASLRCELQAALHWIREAAPRLITQYEELATAPEVREFLDRRGAGRRLGPARNYRTDLKKLADYDKLAFPASTPLWQQGRERRLLGLAGETTPLAFSWSDAAGAPTLLTASQAEALGLVPAPDAPQRTLTLAPGRTFAVRAVRLDYLRFGSCLLQNVEAWLLPPAGEDLGARLGRDAFGEQRVTLQPELLRAVFE